MKIWRRAAGVFKDKNSLFVAAASRRSKYCNPVLEAAVIKATSHDERAVDYKNIQRVFSWVRTSPVHFIPFMRALSRRMQRTRNSIVAIKGLILLHGVLCAKIPAAQKIGHLPFDLSNFCDDFFNPPRRWGFNAFVRAYFAFLDQKSILLSKEFQEPQEKITKSKSDNYGHKIESEKEAIMPRLMKLQELQAMFDMLLDVQPRGGANEIVVLEAMDCIIVEVFDIYSKICDGIANVLRRISCISDKVEAAVALELLQTATRQGDELGDYFDLCREIGLLNASECPKVEPIPVEDMRELETIINGISAGKSNHSCDLVEEDTANVEPSEQRGVDEGTEAHRTSPTVKTTIKWEVFDEEDTKVGDIIELYDEIRKVANH
ncbi:hypothetical protein Nepgr_005410 [Nepenthes gracilis]|uniref:ENTH domain-containing protein n=1 Tax=Nepenthes gracilis TaxID=150966 RepID=A0AAD3XGK5_NEPGR|nr:hypothetical protein Nepgr_005410 [Nepenthes gracilis]